MPDRSRTPVSCTGVDGPLSDNGQARTRTLRADAYPGLTSGQAPRVDIPLTGNPQVLINPPGGSPAAITSLPGLSGLTSTAIASLGGAIPGQTATFAAAPVSAAVVITGHAENLAGHLVAGDWCAGDRRTSLRQ